MLQGYLDRWTHSPLILLLGLNDLLAGIALGAEGKRVSLTASVSQAEIDSLVERLKPMLEGLFERPAPAAASPAGPVAPSGPAVPAPASQEPAQ